MIQPPRILIVDDNQGIHRDFTLALVNDLSNPHLQATEERVFGGIAQSPVIKPVYALEHAMNGLEGIEKVLESVRLTQPFQLAFIDIRMPGIDGVETVERIWKLDEEIQVVFCTAYADYSWDDLARRLGHTDKALVLKKPFDYIEVVQMASTLTEKWRLARQAAMKLEQMELLVAQRTQKYLELQRREFDRLRELDQKGQLPAALETPANQAETPSLEKEPPLVLVVGHRAEVSQTLAEGVGAQCRIVAVPDGIQGFNKARELVPDLVLSDIALADEDGFQLCRKLKHDELACHIPVVLFYGGSVAGAEKRAVEAGAADCLAFPLSPSVLRARIERWLQSAHGEVNQKMLGQPRELAANQVDAEFLRRTTGIIEAQMSDFEFDVESLSRKLFMSRRQLLRKLKVVAGCSPNAFIRMLRLKRAAHLLKFSGMTVSEITYAVGFADLKHFRTVFREQYGLSPAEYGRCQDSEVSDESL